MDVRGAHRLEARRLLELLDMLANSTFRQLVWRRKRGGELNYSQAQVLAYVAQHPGCHMGEVAKAFAVTLSAITHSVDRLEQKAVLTRGKDPADRRVYVLNVTAKGRALAGELDRLRIAALEPVLARMSVRDRMRVIGSLEALVEAAMQRLGDGPTLPPGPRRDEPMTPRPSQSALRQPPRSALRPA